jgi:hypothetical protein
MGSVWKEYNQPGKRKFMQTLAFLWFELQVAQKSLRESFVESQVPAKVGMASLEISRSIEDVACMEAVLMNKIANPEHKSRRLQRP